MPTDLGKDRDKYTEQIVKSTAPKKLIVAGPGTGKTFVFRRALETHGGNGLALTFINNLARDLENSLSGVADARTFHSLCKYLMHRIHVDGLTERFQHYPPLFLLFEQDFGFLGRSKIGHLELERCFHNLDDSSGAISESLRLGSYYDAVAHTDLVYRVFLYFKNKPHDIPKYPLIVVDEYQDFSLLETKFIDLLSGRSPVLVAGDDDQALYEFKHASAIYIRELAKRGDFKRFSLPYCSRCTKVIVGAVEDALREAAKEGLLRGRIKKNFWYFPPEKEKDSEHYPHIIHAHCTVETNKAPLIGRYVSRQVERIKRESPHDIEDSRKRGEPAILVVGPAQFVRRVFRELKKKHEGVDLKESPQMNIDVIDGYRKVAQDNRSRLGWRIIIYHNPFDGCNEVVSESVSANTELADAVLAEYKSHHLRVAQLVERAINGEKLSTREQQQATSAIGRDLDEFEEPREGYSTEDTVAKTAEEPPTVLCTSLLGAKGLSADYVFIVGMNNEHFPRSPSAITNTEVCQFIVGLTRVRKQCYVVSCGRFGSQTPQPSVFLDWIKHRLSREEVSAEYLRRLAND